MLEEHGLQEYNVYQRLLESDQKKESFHTGFKKA